MADELDDPLNPVDGVGRLLVHHHLNQHVAGVDLALDVHLLAVLDLHRFLGGDKGLANRALLSGARISVDAALNERTDFVLVTRGGLDCVPAVLG